MQSEAPPDGPLARRLGLFDAVLLGLGAMIGAGVFAVLPPATAAAGALLPLSVVLAGGLAWLNATSSARLAAFLPVSGGTYAYGTALLGERWGHLAGWGFVVGKTASCAAMAMTLGAYAWPDRTRPVALLAVAAVVALGTGGVQRGARLTRVLLAVALVVLALVVAAGFDRALAGHAQWPVAWFMSAGDPPAVTLDRHIGDPGRVVQAAGLMFFAFAGYARLATLGEEVRDPARVIPRAIGIALAVTLIVYLAVSFAALLALGWPGLALAQSPLAEVVRTAGWSWAVPLVRVGAVAAAGGALLALLLGVSRTAFAMARDGHLPRALTGVRHGVPFVAELAVAAVVAVLVLLVDLRGVIGFSSFAILVYYAIAHAAALRLEPEQGAPPRWIPLVGAAGCLAVAALLPWRSVAAGAAVLLLGLVAGRLTTRERALGA